MINLSILTNTLVLYRAVLFKVGVARYLEDHKIAVGEWSWTKVPNWRPRRQTGCGNRRRVHTGITGKLLFLIEQLRLATISPYRRRYSPSLLACIFVWESSSPSLYKQILKENVLSVPSIRHLHSLSKTFCMDTGLTGNTHSFMVARIKQISEREQHVVLIDEIVAVADWN